MSKGEELIRQASRRSTKLCSEGRPFLVESGAGCPRIGSMELRTFAL